MKVAKYATLGSMLAVVLSSLAVSPANATDGSTVEEERATESTTEIVINAVPTGSLRLEAPTAVTFSGDGTGAAPWSSNSAKWQGNIKMRVVDDRAPGITGWTMTSRISDGLSDAARIPASAFETWLPMQSSTLAPAVQASVGTATGVAHATNYSGPGVPLQIASLTGTNGAPSTTTVNHLVSVLKTAVPKVGTYTATVTNSVL